MNRVKVGIAIVGLAILFTWIAIEAFRHWAIPA